eukprot:TRINITY_DN31850_c0_g1_i1.p1 TRINITY_DN31850_c0_g1~~TRINITY_DN31850_c0_g1_i1.p1  ORF type:complete len:170 (+),score=27.16 TRINITY_DN31850_c0_g1_i1:73-510(+)
MDGYEGRMGGKGVRIQVDSDPFAPPGAENKKVFVTLPVVDPALEGSTEPSRTDPNDPSHWTCEEVVSWVRTHYNDPEIPLDPDLIEAFYTGDIKGKNLLGCYPNTLFKEMRRKYLKPEHTPKVTEELVRETLLLSFKYGGQDSMW